jgi:metal-responsive CopG/Arc/MetJ family transcriptional regulator
MGRVNVFLKDKLLDDINEEAKAEGTSRSALIQPEQPYNALVI